MYYNVKKLTAVRDQLIEIIENYSSSTANVKTEDIRKLFEDQNLDIPKEFKDMQKYSWSSWYLDDLKTALETVKALLTKHINIEDRQSISDSVIDTFIEDSRDAEIGSMKYIFGELSQKDQNIMRDVARKVYEYTKSRKYE